jgi:Raf kinase inhibitor-like YbhB/YbcL family protein
MKKVIINFYLSCIMFLGGFSMHASAPTALIVTSSSFSSNSPIPKKYSKLGDNVSPHISWNKVPAGVKSFVVICQDPDAPTAEPFVHWIIYNIPATSQSIPEGSTLFSQGVNDFGTIGWGGPKPPSGTHHYQFDVYGLDCTLSELTKPNKQQLMNAINKCKTLAKGRLIGTFTK